MPKGPALNPSVGSAYKATLNTIFEEPEISQFPVYKTASSTIHAEISISSPGLAT